MAARRGKSQARRNNSQGTPGWVWLVAGVAIAAVVFLAAPNLFKGDADGFLRAGPRPDPNAQPAPVAQADEDVGAQVDTPAPKQAEPARPAATQYDFYTLLPGKEVEMSDAELAASARAEDQRRARSEAQRAQAALEGRPVPAAAAPAPTSTAATTTASTAVASTATNSPASLPAPLGEAATASNRTPAATAPAATAPAPGEGATAAAPAAGNVRYILQAGAFGASGDAEATKAKLAMIGLAARVESAEINGRTVYRVRMGPYGTAGELSDAKQKLDGTGLQAMAIKAQ